MLLTDQDVQLIENVLAGVEELDDAARGVKLLEQLDDEYFNGDGEQITDAHYDAFKNYVHQLDPSNAYFTAVGASERGGKIELPFQLGSLTQVQIGELADWVKRLKLKPTDQLVLTAKLDGNSGLRCYLNGGLRISYSRGDGYRGADTTRHSKHFSGTVAREFSGWVRGENIVAISAFNHKVQPKFKNSAGREYKNPRNFISGAMNASEHSDLTIYKHLDFVAYDILQSGSTMDKTAQLNALSQAGFLVPSWQVMKVGDVTEEKLAAFIETLRNEYEYEIDGIVVDINDGALRSKLNEDNSDLNPEYAMKYKVADASNYVETEVVEVEYNVSKSRYAKPRVILKPCKLPGITCTYVTGYNAKYILDNGIGPGAVVGISRMGDVVPNIVRIVKRAEAQMPDFPYSWTPTNVDAIALDENNPEVLIQQLVHAATTIDLPHLKEGAIRSLVAHTYAKTFDEAMKYILSFDEEDWVEIIGANGSKIYAGVAKKMTAMDLPTFVGAMPHFGRGVGVRKMKKVFESCKTLANLKMLDKDDIIALDNFEEKTANKIIGGVPAFFKFYDTLPFKPKFQVVEVTGAIMNGQSVCGTGFRDKTFDAWITANGGKVQSGVSKDTTILVASDPKSNSGKVKKANELIAAGKAKIEILSLSQFNEKYGR